MKDSHSKTLLKRQMPKTKTEIVKAIWWLGSTTTILLITCYSIYQILRKTEVTSTVLTLSGKLKFITDVAFPKVTFCPRGYYKIHDLHSTPTTKDNIEKENSHLNRSLTVSELKQLLSRTCELNDNAANSDMAELDFTQILEKVSLFELNVSPGIENVLFNCHFGENSLDYDLEMRKRITEYGICFSFNAVPLDLLYKDTNIEPLPKRTRKNRIFPYYPKGFDDYGRFELDIAIPKNWELSLGCPQKQFAQVSVTNPYDMTTTDLTDTIIEPGEEIYMEYKVDAFLSTDEALRHSPEKRNCLYENENHLRFFKTYSEFNCKLECLSNYTMEKCGCVDFYMPRERSQKVCTTKDLKCVAQAKLQINLESDPSIAKSRCNCKSNCEVTFYETSIFRSVNVNTYFNESIQKDYHIYDLTVFTNSRVVLPFIRKHIYTFTDYVANLGGLIALLMGVSIVSIAEVIYKFLLDVRRLFFT